MLSLATARRGLVALSILVSGILSVTGAAAQTGTWTALAHVPAHYNAGVMLLMTDGTVICKNSNGAGQGTGWDRLTPVNGSYINGTWSTIASMARDRLYFSSQVLPDGRVYVCGGEYGAGGSYGEVYNPATNTWITAGGAGWVFASVVSDANSEILYSGKVLQAVVDAAGTDSNYLWDPVTNLYSKGPKCLRTDNEAMWVKLPDSSVVFVDNYSTTSERYMPKTNTWINDGAVPVNLYDPYGYESGAAFMLPDGRAFFIGSTPTTAYYTPSGTTAPGTWATGPAMPSGLGVADGASAMMANGKVLIAAAPTPTSADHFPSPTYYYEFDYTTNTFTQVGAPGGGLSTNNGSFISNTLDLPDGTVLFCNQGDDQYYVYTPGTGPLAAGKPTINAISRVNCDTFQVTGTLFNGLCEGAGYGDDWQMETNYPIVRMTNGTNVYYATTYNWNRIGAVMTGALPDTAIFKIPATLPPGTYSVVVTANGNPSDPFVINTSLAISPASLTLCQGGTATLTDAQTIGTWSSANSGIATVGSSTGLVTGIGVGTTTLSYSIGQCNATIIATVNIGSGAISGTLSVCKGAVTSLSNATPGGSWSASNANATVDGSGNVTGAAAGTVTISYAPPAGCVATAIVTVNALPTAVITPAGPAEFCTGGNVVLNGTAAAGLTYQWQLAGGNIGGATLSAYTASLGGSYTLVVKNAAGCSATSAATIVTVDTPPTATITPAGPTTFCTGGSVVLNANTGAGYTYQWQQGGGNIGGATTSAYTAGLGGTYAVIVYSGACNTTSSITTVTVTSGPGATITPAGATSFCPGGSVVLNANTGAGITYQWLLGGSTIPGATSSGFTAAAGGDYAVIVSQGGCVVTSATTTVDVLSLPTVTPVGGASNICVLQATTLTDATGAGTWSSSNATIASVDATGNVTGLAPGTAMISYTESNSCGSASAAFAMTVNAATVVSAIAGNTNICVGQVSPLSDITASGVWSSATPGVATVSAGGLVTGVAVGIDNISYTVTNVAGCVSSAVVTVNIIAPFSSTITPASSTSFCTGGFVALNATTGAGYTYQWQVGGTNITGATAATYVANTSGNYVALVTNPGGCVSTSTSVTVSVNPLPIVVPAVGISASLGTVLCATTSMETFSATPTNGGAAPAYQWYVNGAAAGVGNGYNYTPANGDIVKVVMTSNNICAFPDTALASLTMAITPLRTPSVSITSVHGDSTCTGDTVVFAAVPVYGGTAPTYLWTRDGVNVATGPYFQYPPMDGDTLILTMTSHGYPCLTDTLAVSDIFIVHVFPQAANSLSVSVSQTTVVSGGLVTFTAVANGAGPSPTFQWYINGNPIAGATSNVYITDSLQDGQIVNCRETSSFVCSEPGFVTSGGISVSVVASGVGQTGNNAGKFTLVPNPNNGQFTVKGTVGTADNNVMLQVTNVLGQQVYKRSVHVNNGALNELISLDKSVAAGTYQVSITSGEDHVVFHVVIEK